MKEEESKMSKTITVDDRSMKEKFEDFKWNCKTKIRQGCEWCKENPEIAIVVIPLVAKTGTSLVKAVSKNVNLRKQESIKNLYCYDRSLGHYWSLRRELTNQEWLEVDRRKKAGERLADILESMKVLK